jgi:hypothetical protein
VHNDLLIFEKYGQKAAEKYEKNKTRNELMSVERDEDRPFKMSRE